MNKANKWFSNPSNPTFWRKNILIFNFLLLLLFSENICIIFYHFFSNFNFFIIYTSDKLLISKVIDVA